MIENPSADFPGGVKALDKGMELTIERAAGGDPYAEKEIQKHYTPYLKGLIKKMVESGSLFTEKGAPIFVDPLFVDDIVLETFYVLFRGSPLESHVVRDKKGTITSRRQRERSESKVPPIQRWWGAPPNEPPPTFATFLGSIARNITRQHVKRVAGGPVAVGEEIEEFAGELSEVEKLAEGRERSGGSVWVGGKTPNLPVERMRRAQRATPEKQTLGKAQTELLKEALEQLEPKYAEVLELRTRGRSYSAIADELEIPLGTVMNRLYRARKQVEELTGLPIRGLVGTAAAAFGVENRGRLAKGDVREPSEALEKVLAPRKTTVVRARQNPGEVWIYFETFSDVVDLHNEGLIDDDGFDQCVEALDAHGFV